MKYSVHHLGMISTLSPPSRGAWIEMVGGSVDAGSYKQSPPSRGAWIEI